MWSMYAQLWEAGVKIAIPTKALKKWLEEVREMLEISITDYQPTGRSVLVDERAMSLRLSAVAYSNADSLEENGVEEKLAWSTTTNKNIKNAVCIPELTGYIKDMAWSYEKEVRVKAEFRNDKSFERVAIPLTDELIDAMIITASPLFKGSLEK